MKMILAAALLAASPVAADPPTLDEALEQVSAIAFQAEGFIIWGMGRAAFMTPENRAFLANLAVPAEIYQRVQSNCQRGEMGYLSDSCRVSVSGVLQVQGDTAKVQLLIDRLEFTAD